MAVMLVASGQGLIAVISPMKNAAMTGTGLCPIVPRNCRRSISGEIPVQAFCDNCG